MLIFFLIFVCFTDQNFDDLVSSENNLLILHWFSVKPIVTVKYELVVLFMYDGTNYRFQSQIWAHLLNQTLFFCQNNKGYIVPFNTL